MSLLLHIDTSLSYGSVSLAREGKRVSARSHDGINDHAEWLHTAIRSLFEGYPFRLQDLNGIAVCNGPGSYTGLRIGLSAAKGLCFALNIPLITLTTTEVMASAALDLVPNELRIKTKYLFPVIDARRMELFGACYDQTLGTVLEPSALLIGTYDFEALLCDKTILFFGSGSEKLKQSLEHPNAFFTDFIFYGANHMAGLAHQKFVANEFSDRVSTEPFYIKEFYQGNK